MKILIYVFHHQKIITSVDGFSFNKFYGDIFVCKVIDTYSTINVCNFYLIILVNAQCEDNNVALCTSF